MRRLPHGYFDTPEIVKTLQAAGFTKVIAEAVNLPCLAPSAHHLAVALCQGTPMRSEIEARAPQGLEGVTMEVEKALAHQFGGGKVQSTMQAIVFTASS
jgi:ribosomal protein L32E